MRLLECIQELEGCLAESSLAHLKLLGGLKSAAKAPNQRLLSLMKRRASKLSAAKPRLLAYDGFDTAYKFDGRKDTYLHYTTREKAKQIMKDKALKTSGPEYSSYVISTAYGDYVPGTQRGEVCGLKGAADCDIVLLKFKSDKQPTVGFPEEVKFRGGAPIKDIEMLEGPAMERELSKLKGGVIGDDSYVLYRDEDIEDLKLSVERNKNRGARFF